MQKDVAEAVSTFEDRQKAEARAKADAFARDLIMLLARSQVGEGIEEPGLRIHLPEQLRDADTGLYGIDRPFQTPCCGRCDRVMRRLCGILCSGPFIGLEPQARNVPCAVRQDRQGHEDRLVRDRTIAADVDPDRIHEHHLIAGLKRAVLPGRHLLHHGGGNGRDQAGGRFKAVDLLDVAWISRGVMPRAYMLMILVSNSGKRR
jgi:hypothetical protein